MLLNLFLYKKCNKQKISMINNCKSTLNKTSKKEINNKNNNNNNKTKIILILDPKVIINLKFKEKIMENM